MSSPTRANAAQGWRQSGDFENLAVGPGGPLSSTPLMAVHFPKYGENMAGARLRGPGREIILCEEAPGTAEYHLRRTSPNPTEHNKNAITHTGTPTKNGSGGIHQKRSKVSAADPSALAISTRTSCPKLSRRSRKICLRKDHEFARYEGRHHSNSAVTRVLLKEGDECKL